MTLGRSILAMLLGAATLLALSPVNVFARAPEQDRCCKKCQPPQSIPDDQGCGTANCVMQCCRVITVVANDLTPIVGLSAPLPITPLSLPTLHTLTVPDSIFHPPRI